MSIWKDKMSQYIKNWTLLCPKVNKDMQYHKVCGMPYSKDFNLLHNGMMVGDNTGFLESTIMTVSQTQCGYRKMTM